MQEGRSGPKPPLSATTRTDGSAEATAAIGFAAARAATASAALEVITCTGGHQVLHVDERELRASAQRVAAAAVDRLGETHPALT